MNIPKPTSYKNPSSNIVVYYSSKDRVDFTKITSSILLSSKEVDLIWLDGSETEIGKEFPRKMMESSDSAYRLYQNVVGGPDIAIMFALHNFLKSDYELMVLIENDVLMFEGWLSAIKKSMDDAESDGFRVGGASARVFPSRILAANSTYNLLLNSGAGCIALRQDAAKLILKNYRTITGDQLISYFNKIQTSGLNYSGYNMSADWAFEYILYNKGLVVTSPPNTFAKNIDQEENYTLTRSVNSIDPKIIYSEKENIRFPQSPVSGNEYIPVQHLNFSDSFGFINFYGDWKRQWNGDRGPFNFIGKGIIEIKSNSKVIVLCQTVHKNTEVEIINSKNYSNSKIIIEEPCLFELPLETVGGDEDAIYSFQSRSLNIIFFGIIVDNYCAHLYANDMPDMNFLSMPHVARNYR